MHSETLELKWDLLVPFAGLILSRAQCVQLPGGYSLIWAIISMCGPKGYSFSAVLVINRVSILADFGHLGHK